jgi:ATP-binding cassette subfamily C protein LapB
MAEKKLTTKKQNKASSPTSAQATSASSLARTAGQKPSKSLPKDKMMISWNLSSASKDDPLLSCLEIVCSILGKPTSGASLVSGLPLEKNRLTPENFVRAAARAYLSAKLVKKKLSDISKFTLPAVLLLEGEKACVLVDLDEALETYQVIFPDTGKGSTSLTADDLKTLYNGVVAFLKPMYRYDERSIDLAIDKPQQWFWGTLKKSWNIYIQVAISAVLVNLFAIASPLFTMNVYDRVVPNNAKQTLWVLAIGIFIVFCFDFLLRTLRVYFVDTAGKKADILLASRLFEQIMTMQLSSRPLSSGGFASEVREFETLREFFSSVTLVALIDLPFVFLFIYIIYLVGGPVAYVPLIAAPVIIIGALIFQRPLNAWVRKTFREGAQKHGLLVEAIAGLETIKSFGAEGRIQRNWERFVAESANSSKALKFFAALALNFSSLIQQLSYIFLIIVGVYLIGEGQMTMGGLIAASILSSRALAPLTQMISLLTRFDQSMTALAALDKIIHLPTERPIGKTFLHRPLLKGNIEFKNVDFSYADQSTKALDNFSIKVSAGEKIGILGRIGSGKSTAEKLILGLYSPQSGTIKLDGTDLQQIDPADLRKNIGYVPQDIYLFFGSIRENITFGSYDIDEDLFMKAAHISGVYDFVRSHPHGFDMQVGEGGNMLSGGQRQSIAIARALIRDPSIFLLDEPTAQIDHASEANLILRLEEYLKNRTLLLVTHRMPLLKLVDRLIIVDSGKIIADGPKEKIIELLTSSQIRTAT